MTNVPLSILDLSPISAGSDAATALHNSVDLAQHAERWGYRRYWFAEHHFVAVASTRPAVVIGQVAAATNTIRVGSAAVQLGHTTALEAVEMFGILASFYPDRIDFGVGRSSARRRDPNAAASPKTERPPAAWRERDGVVIPPPFDPTALMSSERIKAQGAALVQLNAEPADFADQIADIEAMLDGTFSNAGQQFHVQPGEGSALVPWIFGSSRGQSAQVAGARGLPFVASYHITPGTALDAVEVYRENFVPSKHLDKPYVVVSADVVVADDTETAKHLASSYGHWVHSVRTGAGAMPYPDPDEVPPLTAEQLAAVEDRLATQFVGTAEEVAERLSALHWLSGADELVITSVTHDHADRLHSHELIAKRWGGLGA
ncbi:MAG: LLM class flavin-dependent oxidoreductase [Mycobacterium sp.]